MKFDRLPRNISPHEHGSVAPNHPSFVLDMCVYMYKYTTLVMPLFCASCELLQLSLSFFRCRKTFRRFERDQLVMSV